MEATYYFGVPRNVVVIVPKLTGLPVARSGRAFCLMRMLQQVFSEFINDLDFGIAM